MQKMKYYFFQNESQGKLSCFSFQRKKQNTKQSTGRTCNFAIPLQIYSVGWMLTSLLFYYLDI